MKQKVRLSAVNSYRFCWASEKSSYRKSTGRELKLTRRARHSPVLYRIEDLLRAPRTRSLEMIRQVCGQMWAPHARLLELVR